MSVSDTKSAITKFVDLQQKLIDLVSVYLVYYNNTSTLFDMRYLILFWIYLYILHNIIYCSYFE